MSLLLFSSKTGIPRAGLLHGWDLRFPNLCRWSEDWSQAQWTKNAVTVTSGAADPLSTTLGYTLAVTATGGSRATTIPFVSLASTIYTATIYAKLSASNIVELGIFDNTAAGFVARTSFNLNTGAVVATNNGSATITASTNGFYKLTITNTTTVNTNLNFYIYPGGVGNTTGDSVIVWGAQINEGTTPNTYVKTDDLQFIPNINTSSTPNLLLNNSDYSLGSWSKTGFTVSGTTLTETAASTQKQLNQSVTPTASALYQMYVTLISSGRRYLVLYPQGAGLGVTNVIFDTITKTVFSTTEGTGFVSAYVIGNTYYINFEAQSTVALVCAVYTSVDGAAAAPIYVGDTNISLNISNFNLQRMTALMLGATSAVEASDPIRTNDGSIFDGSTSLCLSALTAPGPTSPITVVVVAKETKDAKAKGALQITNTIFYQHNANNFTYIKNTNNYFADGIKPGNCTMQALTMSDATCESANMYLNTAKTAITIQDAGVSRATILTFYVGSSSSVGEYFLGRISYVLIYNRALPATEIRQLYAALKLKIPCLNQSNLLLYSEDLTQSGTWTTAGNITVNSATQVTVSLTASSALFQTKTVLPSTNYIFSFDAKLGTLTNPKYSVYDLTHTLDIVASTDYSTQIVNTGFSRITVAFTTPAGCTSVRIYPERDGTTTGTLFITRMQLTLLDRAYVQTTTTSSP